MLRKTRIFLLAISALVLLGLLGKIIFDKTKNTTKTSSTFIQRKLDIHGIYVAPSLAEKYRISCFPTPNEKKTETVIVGCTNLYSQEKATSSPGIIIGTARYDLNNQKSFEVLARQTWQTLKIGTSTGPVSCKITSSTINSNIQTAYCTNSEEVHALIRTYFINTQPYPFVWLGLTSSALSEKELSDIADVMFVQQKVSKETLPYDEFVNFSLIEKAYAGGGGGGGGGDSVGADPSTDPAVSPCSVCTCDGTCPPPQPYTPPDTSCPSGWCPPTVETSYTPGTTETSYTPGTTETSYTPGTTETSYTPGTTESGYQNGYGGGTTESGYQNGYGGGTTESGYQSGYQSYETYPSYPTYSGPATIAYFNITPRSVEQGGLVSLSWSIYHPTTGSNACKIVAEVQKPAICDSTCQSIRATAQTSLNTQLSSGKTNTNDPNGASRIMSTALTQANASGYAKGVKSVKLDYSTTFTISCGTQTTPFKSIIYVTDRNEG